MEKIQLHLEKLYYGFPVVLISFYDEAGKPNVTPISSTYTLKDMVMLGFSSKGYAVQQIQKVNDFVINIPDHSLQSEIDFCGSHTGHSCQKFDFVSLTPVPSSIVHAPLIEQCPIALACTLTDVIEKEAFAGITSLIAKIKGRLAAPSYVDADGGLHLSLFQTISYYGDGKKRGFK